MRGNLLEPLTNLLREPPPAMAFEISESGIAVARLRPKGDAGFQPLKPGVISVSPLRDNILEPDELVLAVRAAAGTNGTRKGRDATLILPDYCARVMVLDFDSFPSDHKEQLSLVRFRIRKSVPFDVESAAVAFWPQPAGSKKHDVVVVVAPLEIVTRYEAPFRAAGLNPGLVTVSSLAFLELISEKTLTVVAKLCGRVLTVMVVDKGSLKLMRCLELGAANLDEIAADLYPTFVFVEDQLGSRAGELLLAGFGAQTEAARQRFEQDLNITVAPVRAAAGAPEEYSAGLAGYLHSVSRDN